MRRKIMERKVSKTSIITGVSFIIYALALTVGPNTLYPGCAAEKMMKCTQSLNVLFWIGIVLGIIGIVNFFIKADIYRIVASVVGIIAGVFAFLIPTVIIGACSMATMPCRALTLPVIYVLSGIFIAVTVVNGILLLRARKTQKDSE
ncbi:DUF4418 family protein [Acetobacterium tundrae]|uniref:DUF4418 family protein n=2 Tax=Acetobacterium tundrae TaxID=132932 RepID=A0ABR6WGY2_9FIRM|nr:DUF4418 family protein [Acetobacterium tundrae]